MINKTLTVFFILISGLTLCQNTNKVCEDGKLEKLLKNLSKIKMYEFDFKVQGSSEQVKKETAADFVKIFIPDIDSAGLTIYSKEIVCCSWTKILKNKIDYAAADKYNDYPERVLNAQMYMITSVLLANNESFNNLHDLFYYQDEGMGTQRIRHMLKPTLIEKTHEKQLFIIVDLTERGDFKSVSEPLIKLLKKL